MTTHRTEQVAVCKILTDSGEWHLSLPTFSRNDDIYLFVSELEEIFEPEVFGSKILIKFRFPAFRKSLLYSPSLSLHINDTIDGMKRFQVVNSGEAKAGGVGCAHI
jgi:hypothetical protein